jgi:hypothetical protein
MLAMHVLQLETQIYELEKGQQNNENKTKLERLKEMLSKEKKKKVWLYIRRNSIEAQKSWWEYHGVLKYSTFE